MEHTDRETAAERIGVEATADTLAGELARLENAATVARFLAETCMGGAGYKAKHDDVIPVAARIYATALLADTRLSDVAASVAVEYEAREVRTERIQAEQEAERERLKQEKAEQAAKDAKAAVLGGPNNG